MTMFETAEFTPDIEAVKAKYGNDPDKIAEGYAHADKHIKELQQKLDAKAAEAAQGKTLAEVLEALRVSQNSQSAVTPPGNIGTVDNKDAPDVKQAIADFFNEQRQKEQREKNLQDVADAFRGKFKDKAQDQFNKVATDAGLSPAEFQALTAQNPRLVLKLAGLDQEFRPTQNGPTNGSVNPQALQATRGGAGSAGTKSYWDKFRKDNPGAWQTNNVQAQIRADFDRDPDFFLNN